MNTILLESPSLDLLQPVVELAQQLGIRIRRVDDYVAPIDRDALERILDEKVHIEPSPKPKLSERFRGSITAEEAEAFNQYLQQSRDEWERPI